ncbi:RNA polymerase factor sigma-54 [Aureibacter tunicatorum]|uniref:RNA polymerase sigma-54 factor n=1 Tax=Aureibacter tunicatorum TaxID=866807 RepID=A0AAE3XK56_9BACT|nr:RNA polymerase factor sigma-54 [Aureibacter tunicatorum]MDR6237405.1 RNA polymerase sigma-54 factor [Aureibacter tunicatorum]BDD06395.1 RNA polymerase sigma-54 factor [Aureibacter tunicatorum]
MQKLELSQTLGQKLSPQQIQFIKLLQVPTAELESRVEEELEVNPALEEGADEVEGRGEEDVVDDFGSDSLEEGQDINLDEYLHDDYNGYKMYGDGFSEEEEKDVPMAMTATLNEQLLDQLNFVKMDPKSLVIAKQLIGSIESDGYIRRELSAIVNDLAFSQNVMTSEEEAEAILHKIQLFDPAGIAARDLQECLKIQLERKEQEDEDTIKIALRIINECYEDFTKKHYEKIAKKLGIKSVEDIKDAMAIIIKLNPKPGNITNEYIKTQYLIPDFLLSSTGSKLELTLNSKNAPELRINKSYSEMIETYDKSKKKDKKLRETVTFVKQKLDAAKWFIDAIRQRQQTLLNTMNAIIEHQIEFFQDGDESKLKPMILKDIAERIDMDISTISRVANSKSIQTDFGIYPLKYFFSEGITTDTGESVSSREVKHTLKGFIDHEDKRKPLSDDKLEKLLKAKGYNIARRTVAKYREQLNIPVARLRKELI